MKSIEDQNSYKFYQRHIYMSLVLPNTAYNFIILIYNNLFDEIEILTDLRKWMINLSERQTLCQINETRRILRPLMCGASVVYLQLIIGCQLRGFEIEPRLWPGAYDLNISTQVKKGVFQLYVPIRMHKRKGPTGSATIYSYIEISSLHEQVSINEMCYVSL